ncbi:MAG: glycerophosphodiester phosphodiesterase family protein [Microbacterium sp.]
MSTVSGLLALAPFYIAHRGSGDNWPEHTATAYRNAAAAGAQAIEISVNATSDGVLVCHHDPNTLRLTGVDREIGRTSWAELSELKNDAREWLGPRAPLEPIPRLSDVLDLIAADHVIFIEDKQGTNTKALLDVMDSYPESTKHFVWKQWAGAHQQEAAKQRGYKTWGYFSPDDEITEEVVEGFDYLGVHHTATDDVISELVATGKPVIAWEVHYRSVRDRLSALGVVGMMCSNIPYVTSATALAAQDSFATGMRNAGDLPWTVDLGWKPQPQIIADTGTVVLDYPDLQSYLMGSLAPIDASNFEISFRLRWPKKLPAATQHAGIAFGLEDDRPYRVGVPSGSSGYHAVLRANGSLELFVRAKGETEGTMLGAVQTPAPAAGEWIDLVVSVGEARVAISRDRNLSWEAAANDDAYRGGYFWLCKNYAEPIAVEYSSVVVE